MIAQPEHDPGDNRFLPSLLSHEILSEAEREGIRNWLKTAQDDDLGAAGKMASDTLSLMERLGQQFHIQRQTRQGLLMLLPQNESVLRQAEDWYRKNLVAQANLRLLLFHILSERDRRRSDPAR